MHVYLFRDAMGRYAAVPAESSDVLLVFLHRSRAEWFLERCLDDDRFRVVRITPERLRAEFACGMDLVRVEPGSGSHAETKTKQTVRIDGDTAVAS